MLPTRPFLVLTPLLALLLPVAAPAQAPAPAAGCGPAACGPAAAREPCLTFQADYLLWFLGRGRLAEPLAATTDAPPGAAAGPLAFAPLLGPGPLGESEPRSGLRLRAAYLAPQGGAGLELSGFLLERSLSERRLDPASVLSRETLARPIVDVNTGLEGLNVLNLGDALAGSLTASSFTKLYGAEAAATRAVGLGPVEAAFAGYRWLALREGLAVADRTVVQAGGVGFFGGLPVDEQDARVKLDRFSARNDFHGAVLGLRAALRAEPLDLTLRASVAVGVSQQRLDVDGLTAYQPANPSTANPLGGNPLVLPGGLLALPSNIGSRSTARFAVLPEAELSAGYQVAPWWRVSVGYTFLYLSSAVRPGEQVGRVIDPAQVPVSPTFDPNAAAAAPQPAFRASEFWAHGLSLGMQFSF